MFIKICNIKPCIATKHISHPHPQHTQTHKTIKFVPNFTNFIFTIALDKNRTVQLLLRYMQLEKVLVQITPILTGSSVHRK